MHLPAPSHWTTASVCFKTLLGSPLTSSGWVEPGASSAHSTGPTNPACICVSTPSCLLAGPLPPDTSRSVPILGFLREGHTSQPEASHLLEPDLAPQPCLSGLSGLLLSQSDPPPHTHTSTCSTRLLPPRGLPRPYHDHLPPPSPPTCAPLGHPCTFQPDLTPIGEDIRLTSSSYPPQVEPAKPKDFRKSIGWFVCFSLYCSLKKANRFGEKFLNLMILSPFAAP